MSSICGGVKIRNKAIMFGANESVVNSATAPHAKLLKRHNALSFHRVREVIASRVNGFYHVRSAENLADILSKHWGFKSAWPLFRCLFLKPASSWGVVSLYQDR